MGRREKLSARIDDLDETDVKLIRWILDNPEPGESRAQALRALSDDALEAFWSLMQEEQLRRAWKGKKG